MENPGKTMLESKKIKERSWLTYRTHNNYTLQIIHWEIHQSAYRPDPDSFLCLAKSGRPSFPPEAEGQDINLVFIDEKEKVRASGCGLVESMVSVPWRDQRVYLITGTLIKFEMRKLEEKKKNVFS